MHAQRSWVRTFNWDQIFKNYAEAKQLKEELQILKSLPEYAYLSPNGII
jgi:hypothetical protein